MKQLRDILFRAGVIEITGSADIPISSLHFDSRNVTKKSLFVAIKGTQADGHRYISLAIDNGATAIVCEKYPENDHPDITYVLVKDSSFALGMIASHYYGNPSAKLNLIGITGTNGKTTTVTLLHRLFLGMGLKAGLISTVENKINEAVLKATHTTPDPVNINELLARMVAEGCLYCFMEVSSHAIDQQRIAGLTFSGGVFTNITHDHLDYHKTFEAYLKAKKSFFDGLNEHAFALTNKDDKNGMVMTQNTRAKVFTYSTRSMTDFKCRIIENQFQGLQLDIDGNDCWFRLIGSFNAYNLLAVYATAILLGQMKAMILPVLSNIEPAEGRFTPVVSKDNITVIIDYAHTPDALKNVLETINAIRFPIQQLITIIGAGGNRDTGKRPVMAKIACMLSNKVILTSDNPRFEEPEAILEEMKKGVEPQFSGKVLEIVNRRDAIKIGCALCREGDILLIAGKGHENYQEIKGIRYPFSDKEIVKEVLEFNN